MKKKFFGIFLALAIALAVPLAGCSDKDGTDEGSAYVASSLYPAVFYDDTGKNYVAEKDKTSVIELKEGVSVASYKLSATDLYGNTVENAASVATFDEETLTVTAVGSGILNIDLCDEEGAVLERVSVTSQGAYPGDPSFDALSETASDGVNGSHDPSIVEHDGYYYVLTTGWGDGGNQIRRSQDMIHWEKTGTTFSQRMSSPYSGRSPSGKAWTVELADVAEALDAPSINAVHYWAPDIIKCPDKEGFWLYSCAVYTADLGQTDGNDRACIFLCYSEDLTPGSFEYVGMIFQSCLPVGQGNQYINAIDPQIIFTKEGDMYMAYGSFHAGLYIMEMSRKSGLRAAGMNKVYSDEEVQDFNYERDKKGSSGKKYCGTIIAEGQMEAPVIARHDNVQIYDDAGNVTDTIGSRYFLMSSYGALAATYNMRYGISDNSVTGVYKGFRSSGVDGEMLDSDNGISGNGYKALGAFDFIYADGTNMSAKAEYSDDNGEIVTGDTAYNVYAPGHNDLYTTRGINISTRINRYYNTELGSSFALFLNQYYLNSQGQIVINPNRYAGERLRTVTAAEVANLTQGNYQAVFLNDMVYTPIFSEAVTFTLDGTDGGTLTHRNATYTWQMIGDYFIKIANADDTFYGVVAPSWLEGVGQSGLAITAISAKTGMSLYLNSDPTVVV